MCISLVLISLIDSSKEQNQGTKQRHDDSKLPSNPEEVEDLRRDTAANPLIAFTYDELKIVTANFRPDRVLGGGGFGSVYKGFISEELIRQGLPTLAVAVKVHDGDNSHQGHREWLAEVIFLGQLSHPNLVKLIGYCCEDEHRVLIYEYMSRGSVEHNLFSKILLPMPWSTRMKIAFGAAKGLAFLHEADKPVIYRDFKTSNILLDQEKKKFLNIIDPRLDGDYPIKAVHKAAMLAYHCLNRNPKARPLMRDIVDSLEPLQAHTEVPIGKTLTIISEVPESGLKMKDEAK
ncbi:hypothetical protein JHK85_013545 [Glycine max]|nr:hypothetical protein JHK85_013545 [Glycine max]